MAQADSDQLDRFQKIRKTRLLMTVGSYLLTYSACMVCFAVGLLEFRYTLHFLLMTALVNGAFFLCFHWRLNLYFKDHNLTAAQMVLSLLPALYVMYFVEDNQARSALMMVAIVPFLYGVLGIDTRAYIKVAVINVLFCASLIGLISINRPYLVDFRLEAIQLSTLSIVMLQLSWLGGYISRLRSQLRKKNRELNDAFKRISELALIDELTGISNRRHLMEVLEREQQRCMRGGEPFSLCIMDIDFFKQINDTYGHLAGDEVIRKVAQVMGEDMRMTDCLGRYGGEEFLFIMPQTPLHGAQAKAERIRSAIESIDPGLLGIDRGITGSLGVAEYHPGKSYEDTLARADNALYEAKHQGRNRVIIALEQVGRVTT